MRLSAPFVRSFMHIYVPRSQARAGLYAAGSEYAADHAVALHDLRELWQNMGGDVAKLDAIDAGHMAQYKENMRRMKDADKG